jgi:UDP-N-acetylglucosamine acyltransferase
MSRIHPSAVVSAQASLHESVEIGPYAVIGADVEIGEGCVIGPHCTLEGPMRMGRFNRIHAHAALGGAPQDKKYAGEPTRLEIGDRNTIREFCTLNRGTVQDGGCTHIADDNWVMAYVHIAHDCRVGSHTILANNATLAGHVHLGDYAIVGGLTGIHQFCHVGAHAITGFQSHVSQDVPPFMTVAGNPLAVAGINVEGLKRRHFGPDRIAVIKQMHRLLYRQGLTLAAATEAIAALGGAGAQDPATARDDVQTMLSFLEASTRGIVR